MMIVKCSCGCLFTLKETSINSKRWISCPECGNKFYFDPERCISDTISECSKNFDSVQKVPDNAKLTVTFDT